MKRSVKYLQHLPPYMREYTEIIEISKAKLPELQLLSDEQEVAKQDQFILSCSEQGISRFEAILKITPGASDTLEARRARVLSRWNDTFPYTYSFFKKKMDALCGEGNYILDSKFNVYELYISTYLRAPGQVEELQFLVDYMMPCNIEVFTTNSLFFDGEASVYLASVLADAKIITIDI